MTGPELGKEGSDGHVARRWSLTDAKMPGAHATYAVVLSCGSVTALKSFCPCVRLPCAAEAVDLGEFTDRPQLEIADFVRLGRECGDALDSGEPEAIVGDHDGVQR